MWPANHLAAIHNHCMLYLEHEIGAHGYLAMNLAWMKKIVNKLLARIENGNNCVVKDDYFMVDEKSNKRTNTCERTNNCNLQQV